MTGQTDQVMPAECSSAAVHTGALFTRKCWLLQSESVRNDLWLLAAKELGFRCEKVGIGYFNRSNGRRVRGTVALADVHAGEEVCIAPERAILSTFTVRASSLKRMFDGLHPHRVRERNANLVYVLSMLSVFVLREAERESSPFIPYIYSALQQDAVSSIPATWAQSSPQFQALSAMQKRLAVSRRTTIDRSYADLFPRGFDNFSTQLSEGICSPPPCARDRLAAIYSPERFRSAYVTLKARNWHVRMLGARRVFCAPFIDLINMGDMGIETFFDDARRVFVAKASVSVRQGEELLWPYYGSKPPCKEVAFNTYGWAPEDAAACKPKSVAAWRERIGNGGLGRFVARLFDF